MADAQANIDINLNASQALATLRSLQAEISLFQQKMTKLNANANAQAVGMQRNLLNSINSTGQFSARMTTIASSTESFTNALEKNKLSMGQYFRYAGASSKNFSKLFRTELDTVNKVARERVKTLQTQYIKMGRDASGSLKAIAIRPLALDMESLATKTAIASQKQALFNQLIRQGSTNMLNWGKNTQWAGRQLMVGFTIPLTIFGTVASKAFMDLEEQAIRFKRVYGELFTSQAETDKMLASLKELGSEFTKYGVALKDTMAMAADAAAMGKMGADLLAQVSQASRLAVLGGVGQQEALDTTISLTNTFGIAADKLSEKIDFLNAVENQTVVSIEDLTTAIPKAGPVVKQLGGDVEDLAFFLTAMKEGGINASEGANALKSGLASLINPSAKASEMLAGFGININGIVEANAGDIKGTVIEFAKALDTLDPLNRARAIEQLFGKFQFSRLSTLFQNVVAEGNQASRVLKLTASSTEELAILSQRELQRIEDSPLFKFRKAWEDLTVALAPVGEAFLKAVTPIMEFGTKILNKFNDLSDGGKQVVIGLVATLGVIAPSVLMIVGLFANGVANIIKFFAAITQIGKGSAGVRDLGTQTEYMTQQQLEAQAVAAALNQTHTNLKQTFSSETAAVRVLTAAYQEQVAAQRLLLGVPVRGGRARGMSSGGVIPKYANGIFSVPGPKGAGDVVPAMLSPGEAVIPAKQAQKYGGFIKSMIADNVPGFRSGYSYPGSKPISEANPIELAKANAAAAATEKELLKMRKEGTAITNSEIESAKTINRSHRVDLTGLNKKDISLWDKPGMWNPRTGGENNLIGDTVRKSPNNQKVLSEYLKKTNASSKDIRSIMDKTQKGIALSNREASIQGKALRAIGKDWSAGKIPKKAMSATFGKYARAVGVGQLAADKLPQSDWTPAQKKAADRHVASLKKSTNANEQNTKTTQQATTEKKKNTAAVKKVTKTTTQAAKAAKKSATVVPPVAPLGKPAPTGPITSTVGKDGKTYYSQGGRRIPAPAPAPANAQAPKGRMGVGGIGMATMTAGMVAGMMPGEAGQKLAGPLMAGGMAMSLWPTLQPLIMTPIGALVAVIGASVAAILVWNARIKQSAKRGAEFAESIGMTTKSVQTLSEFTGTVSATELRKKSKDNMLLGRQPFTADQLAFGQSFVETDQGKQMIETVNRLQKEGRSSQEIGSTIARNLTNAMLQGVLTEDQARGIVQALGQELNDYSIPMNISGKLTELVGIDGVLLNKDPFQLSVEIQKDAMNDQAEMFGATLAQIAGNNLGDFIDSKQAMWGSVIGGVTGAIVGGVAGAVTTGGLGTGAGAVVGGLGGATAGGGFGAALAMEEKNTELRSMAINLGYDALELGQQQLDSIDMQYSQQLNLVDQKISQATTEAEINRLMSERQSITDRYTEAQGKILDQNQQIVDSLVQQAELIGRKKFFDISKESALGMFPGMEALIGPAMDTALKMSETKPAETSSVYDNGLPKYGTTGRAYSRYNVLGPKTSSGRGTLKGQAIANQAVEDKRNFAVQVTADFMGGNLSPFVFNDLIEAGSKDTAITRKYNVLAKEVGGAKTGQLVELLSHYGQGPGAEDTGSFKFAMNFAAKNVDKVDKVTEAIAILSGVDTAYGFEVDLSENGVEERLNEIMAGLEILKDYPDMIDLSTVTKDAAGGNEIFQQFLDSYGDLENLGDVSKSFLIDFIATMNNPDLVSQYMAATGQAAGGVARQIESGSLTKGDMTTAILKAQGKTPGTNAAAAPVTDTSGGGTDSSWLDPIVQSQRDNLDLGQQITAGWDDSLAAIKNFSKGGVAALGGLSGKLRSMKVPETMIKKILGMDADEWEKRKGELFNLDENGAITSLNAAGEAVKQAMATTTIGNYVSGQKGLTASIGDQVSAYHKLVGAGMAAGDAYDMVQDKALASAIATTKSSADIAAAAQAATEALKAQKELEDIKKEEQRRNAIRDAIKETNAEFEKQRKIIEYLNKNRSQYTNEQISAIMSDKNLRDLVLEPKIDKGALAKALANAEQQANLELSIKKLTVGGQSDVFRTGLQAAMSQFGAREQQIELNFKIKIADDSSLISSAQEQISKIEFQLDDYQAALQEIDWAEKEINDSYEKRFEALDKIAEANDQIAASQAKQLDLADALSRGDIAAAAKAAQDMRAQQQEDALATQRRMMESAQSAQIAMARSTSGLTREELEAKILQLEKDRFAIEENTLEPAQERIRLAELAKQQAIDGLEVLGKTRDAWDAIANSVDLAQANGYKFADAMREALNIVETLISGYLNKPKPAKATAKKSSGGGGGSSAATPTPTPTPPTPTGTPGTSTGTSGTSTGTSGTSYIPPVVADRVPPTIAGGITDYANSQRPRPTPAYIPPAGVPTIIRSMGGVVNGYAMGGMIKRYNMGGKVMKYATGGYSMGSDTIPAMLTPGEFVVRRPAVNGFGVKNLEDINRGTYDSDSVYNYNLNVNVKSDANPNEIANTVMRSIKQVEGRRIRGNQL